MDWLLDAGLGILGAGGDIWANRSNERIARDNRRFQERMSNTAAQRSVADYRAAGLNPALAYERSASTPPGAVSTNVNPASTGISTAQASRSLRQSLEIARQQNEADLGLKQAQTQESAARGATALLQGDLFAAQSQATRQSTRFGAEFQPHELRMRAADALLRQYLLPRESLKSRAFDTASKGINRGISEARGFSDYMRDWFLVKRP